MFLIKRGGWTKIRQQINIFEKACDSDTQSNKQTMNVGTVRCFDRPSDLLHGVDRQGQPQDVCGQGGRQECLSWPLGSRSLSRTRSLLGTCQLARFEALKPTFKLVEPIARFEALKPA